MRLARVSIGTAICLGLDSGYLSEKTTTAYILTYYPGRCTANCAFCAQARMSSSNIDLLSRVEWPPFAIEKIIEGLVRDSRAKNIKRICLQALDYPGVEDDIVKIVESFRAAINTPLSVSCPPFSKERFEQLVSMGVDRVGISLDTATEEVFNKIKGESVGGPYTWDDYFNALSSACRYFGDNHVVAHLIAGLGETEIEMLRLIQKLHLMSVYPALFAFTPIPGTLMEKWPRPSIDSYRRIQLACYLITKGYTRFEEIVFDTKGRIKDFGVASDDLRGIVLTGEPFLTTGCPDCNRPYYNESPGGPIYNYPRPLRREEIKKAESQLGCDFKEFK